MKKFQNISNQKVRVERLTVQKLKRFSKILKLIAKINEVEKVTWISFKKVSSYFLGNNSSSKYKEAVNRMAKIF